MEYLSIILLLIVIGLMVVLFIDSLTTKVKICDGNKDCYVSVIEKMFS